MTSRGAILVVALVAAGLAAASVAVWYQHRQTHRALALWGAAAAQRIERAAIVELAELDGEGRAADGMFDGAKSFDVSQARGVLHFRRSLLQDANFDWSTPIEPSASENEWDYAARFSDDAGSVVVLFDLDRGLVAQGATPSKVAVVTERMAQGLRRFFDDVLAR